jgi:hypothetical protein
MQHILRKEYPLGTPEKPTLHALRLERLARKARKLEPLYKEDQKKMFSGTPIPF